MVLERNMSLLEELKKRLPSKFLCTRCHHSEGVTDEHKVQCSAAKGEVEPVLKKHVRRFDDCQYRSSPMYASGILSPDQLKELARFARSEPKKERHEVDAYEAALRQGQTPSLK
jgi:cytochrome c553